MEVLAHPLSHNGVLFAVGWKPDFELTARFIGQYLVLEFVHSQVRPSNSRKITEIFTLFLRSI